MSEREKISIRKAELRDAGTVAKFNTLMAMETEHKELDPDTILRGVKAIIKDPHKGFYLVAESRGEVVGQLMVTPEWSDWRDKYFWWIQSVYVREDHRKRGIYTSLYEHLQDMAQYRKDVVGLRLYVEKQNEAAKATYERLGMFKSCYDLYEVLFES